MEKYKNYLIIFLILLLLLGGLVGSKYLGSPKDQAAIAAYRDTLTLYKYQKDVIDKKVETLTADNKLLLESVDSIHKSMIDTRIVYQKKIVYINKYTAGQVDSTLTAAYPLAPSNADTTILRIPTWRAKSAEVDLVLGQQAIALNGELKVEIGIKDHIIDKDQEIIEELQAKDSLSTKQLAMVEAKNAVETKVLKKENRRLKWKSVKIIIGAGVIWGLTVLALKG